MRILSTYVTPSKKGVLFSKSGYFGEGDYVNSTNFTDRQSYDVPTIFLTFITSLSQVGASIGYSLHR